MFRARRYRISLLVAVIFVLLILHFGRSRDQSVVLQVPPPPADDHKPPIPDHDVGDQAKNDKDNGDNKNPVKPPAPLGQPGQSGQHQPPSKGSNDRPAPPIERPGRPDTIPSQDKESSDHSPQTGAQTQSHNDEGTEEDTSSVPHWKPMPEQFPIDPETLIKLPTGPSKSLPKLQVKAKDESSTEKMHRMQQLESIKSAFLHAWNGYKVSAMGHDEVYPLRGGFSDPYNGWGATLVDTLDTLWIMDLKQEFSMAVDYLKKIDFTTTKREDVPVFETVIRYLGGMLGAYDISGHKYDVLLEKSVELANFLMGAFDTPNRMPDLYYMWKPEYATRNRRGGYSAVLAELGSLSMEFTRLAQLTKDNKYYDAIARITNALEDYQDRTKLPGLWPLNLDSSGCREIQGYEREVAAVGEPVQGSPLSHKINPTSQSSHHTNQFGDIAEPAYHDKTDPSEPGSSKTFSKRTPPPKQDCYSGLNDPISGVDKFGLGALGDSTYELLPKEYLLLGGNNDQYLNMYKKAMVQVRKHLVYQPMLKNNRDVRFLSTMTMTKKLDASFTYEGTHLACFAGGMFAIGSKLLGLEDDLKLAGQLTDGCVWAYEATKTGIMPEAFLLVPCEKGKPCEWNDQTYYAALDPYAAKRLKSNSKRSAEPEKGNWHVVSTSESNTPAEKEETKKETTQQSTTNGPAFEKSTTNGQTERLNSGETGELTQEEFVTKKIHKDRLPPGMVGIPARQYLLRPEAIESVFVMFRLTGDSYWREKGWNMFQAIDKATRTDLANSAIRDVTVDAPRPTDNMQSFWTAETLKYFYLLFSDPSVMSLDEYVL